MCHKQQLYDVWFLRYWAQWTEFFCHLGPFFATQKIKILKKWKKCLEISFYTSVPKIMIMLYCSWDMACNRCNCYFSFWAIFCPFTPLTAQKNQNVKKNEKNAWRYHFTQVYQKSWSDDVWFLDMVCDG